mgnify:CR=1 FL=1|jgi:hypothetical protein
MTKKDQYSVKPDSERKSARITKSDIANQACEQIIASERNICEAVSGSVRAVRDVVNAIPKSIAIDYSKKAIEEHKKIADAISSCPYKINRAFEEQLKHLKKYRNYMFTIIFICSALFTSGIMMMIFSNHQASEMRNQMDEEKSYADYGKWVLDNTGGVNSKLFKRYKDERNGIMDN